MVAAALVDSWNVAPNPKAIGAVAPRSPFQTPTGRLWRESGFYRGVWRPAREASGIDIRPHECRHSYITHLRRAGIDDADLAGSPATASRPCSPATHTRSAGASRTSAARSVEASRNAR